MVRDDFNGGKDVVNPTFQGVKKTERNKKMEKNLNFRVKGGAISLVSYII